MAKWRDKGTMTELLRHALDESKSIRGVDPLGMNLLGHPDEGEAPAQATRRIPTNADSLSFVGSSGSRVSRFDWLSLSLRLDLRAAFRTGFMISTPQVILALQAEAAITADDSAQGERAGEK